MVSTLAVEWIEIDENKLKYALSMVSTLAVEWIEIHKKHFEGCAGNVSTLAVEWIEIYSSVQSAPGPSSLHPCGGVD